MNESDFDRRLKFVLQELSELDLLAVKDGVSTAFLEYVVGERNDEFLINGNRAGLLHFAKSALQVAMKKGAHQHMDEHGVASRVDLPVVICQKPGPWETEAG